ncbi:hypothetical protein A4H97_29980 [Niastella yeongjuensis]|uniref:Carbohydrate-binding protein SusD n=1 Tax=Niastella yeongjuensis TaxID=354355 RepID=A0A1V9EQ47_9BACT|nr:RagB/SusD family nutrient uptake outer membrane protein [Niastella yeongjuensis]OQP48064.1 hypothetical protein A4H97_29980 [Niastella yeongjuensis]SEO25375.1 SusD family protein [Niastella yeongjuensis]
MKPNNITILYLTIFFFLAACHDKDLLSENTDSSLLTINSVENAQALLDNTSVIRETPGLGELSADDFYLDDTLANSQVELNAYTWQADIFQGQTLYGDWAIPYKQIFFANSIIEAIPKFSGSAKPEAINNIKGSAKFIRAYAHYNIALEFAKLYSQTAATDPGIPLRLSADHEIRSSRASVEATYNQIINDLKEALPLLPATIDDNRKNRPSLAAGYALLARVYLTMADYAQATLYADSCLKLHANLIDYNSIPANSLLPFTPNNAEVIYQSSLLSTIGLFYQDNFVVDTTLYNSYDLSDLRKSIYFTTNWQGKAILKPGYSGGPIKFSGLATDEILLIRAESNARLNNTSEAMNDLNTLLGKRWNTGSFVPFTAASSAEALDLILAERRKSLISRGLRWIDVRRYNLDNRGIDLTRLLNGKKYTLSAGNNRFVLPIPPDVIASLPEMPQNPR